VLALACACVLPDAHATSLSLAHNTTASATWVFPLSASSARQGDCSGGQHAPRACCPIRTTPALETALPRTALLRQRAPLATAVAMARAQQQQQRTSGTDMAAARVLLRPPATLPVCPITHIHSHGCVCHVHAVAHKQPQQHVLLLLTLTGARTTSPHMRAACGQRQQAHTTLLNC
jgi:hypothetical protein